MASKENEGARPAAPRSPVIVALDHADAEAALSLANRLPAGACAVKIGKELFTREGPAVVRRLVERGLPVFLDLKFHDIPNTVAAACRAATELGVWMIDVHASGGRDMLLAAREAVDAAAVRPLLIAVTVLTSLDAAALAAVGVAGTVAEQVERLARLARDAALDGVVCSPQELTEAKRIGGADFIAVTPGIRPAGAAAHDQQRIATPLAALRAGADYLVIGRPITRAPDPAQALAAVMSELASELPNWSAAHS